jgi:hypothetical protein
MLFFLPKVTAFDSIECFEKWPLAAESEIFEFFPNKSTDSSLFEKTSLKLNLKNFSLEIQISFI